MLIANFAVLGFTWKGMQEASAARDRTDQLTIDQRGCRVSASWSKYCPVSNCIICCGSALVTHFHGDSFRLTVEMQ